MDLVSRLKLFLEQNGIANSQFADTCEIPRPTISQLLNGRNKKVSDEVISKIHLAYPALNIMWLMFGDGNMFVDGAASAADQNLSKTPQQAMSLMGGKQGDSSSLPSPRGHATISFGDDRREKNGTTGSALSDAIQNIAKSVSSTGSTPAQGTGRRRIVNIMIFYDDNSFESVIPSR